MASNSIKVRYNLHTYRMVSEGSDAMRYVKHGNLDGLKASIESGQATIWDTAPDGWSLLHVRLSYLPCYLQTEALKHQGTDRRIQSTTAHCEISVTAWRGYRQR